MGIIHKMLVQLMLLLVLVLATTVTPTTAQAKLGCSDQCGDLHIPYPFGTNEKCYLNETFLISCDHSSNPPKALWGDGISVTSISLQGQLLISQYITRDCYDQDGMQVINDQAELWVNHGFTISTTQNKFIAIGCGDCCILSIK
ncbi:hypothetical protein L1049_012155 [Liquidambar formosana]|uniref:Wall-associated receptor kinase galacturonan-binding domain-containing protein n=1 Tax=Liquidambar formosana TaxID=63359 RepID=A0AAP0X3U1_LIQFO